MTRAHRFFWSCIVLAVISVQAMAANNKYMIRKQICQMDDSCFSGSDGGSPSGGSAQLGAFSLSGDPAAMDITGGSSPGDDVVFTITNTGETATGTLLVSLTGDTGNFSKTADTCNGQALAASASCSITIQPVATENGSYAGTLQVSGTPGGTVSQALSGTAIGFVVDPGTVVPDGSVYVGLSPDGNVPMYVTRCDAGMSWDGSACAGTRSGISWNNGTANWTTTGVTDAITGEVNTAILVSLIDSASPHQAVKYCHDLVDVHGHSDWYLPAKDELNVIYLASVAVGGTFRASFDISGVLYSGYYWSSSEYASSHAWRQIFSAGSQYRNYKNGELSVRCARKDSATLGMTVPQGDPAAMDITGGSSPGDDVVFTITNTGETATGTLLVSLTGDTGNFSKTADTCNGQALAASASCSITIQPVATENGSYAGTLQVSGTPGGTVSQTLSGTAIGFVVDPGTVVPDGSVYVGLSPDGNVPMYVTRCDAGMSWDGSACTGTRSALTWGTYGTTTGITDVNTGEANTTALAVYGDTAVAKYCDNLDMHGKMDWYLPSQEELNVIYLASVAAGGTFRSSFDLSGSAFSGVYWSSSEYNAYNAWYQRFSDGYQNASKLNGRSARCSRR